MLLAGFAFEAYRDPVGGTRDCDTSGGSTAYLSAFVRECFAGVLEVHLLDASELAAGDVLGTSDPYVLASVGDSAHRSGTRRFTLSPSWDEKWRLFVRDVDDQTLMLRVMDEDLFKEDDTLGVAALSLSELADGKPRTLTLPVTGGGAGPGGGTLRLSLRYLAFEPPPPLSATPTANVPWWELVTAPLAAARSGGSPLQAALASVNTFVSGQQRDAERRRAEKELWAVPPDDDWALLASGPTSTSAPSDFEKLAFVANENTDTQVAVWRCVASRTVIVAFRGTEQAKLGDLLTDARLMPRSFDPERGGGGGGEERGEDAPAAHDGFLEAYDSVRVRVLAAVDDARGAGPRAAALGRNDGAGWSVCVTGHSLGGALATLCALELAASVRSGSRSSLSVSMVNFGSPRVGNAAFCRLYDSLVTDSCRIVNGADAVPTVPALLGYRHVQHGVRIASGGAASRELHPSASPPEEGSIAALALSALSSVADAGAIGRREAAEVAAALASLADATALEAHMEDQYLVCLRRALEAAAAPTGSSGGEA